MSLPLRKQVISRAYQLIEDPNHWTTFALARDESGLACLPGSEIAVRFCARGALYRAACEICPDGSAALFKTVTWSLPWLALVNDFRGHTAVLKHLLKCNTATDASSTAQ
jgi:hypothetical protein